MKRFTRNAALLAALAGAASALGCSNDGKLEREVLSERAELGGVKLALSIPGGLTVNTISAELTFPDGRTQTHSINVQAEGSTPTIYFRLPVGTGYQIDLSAVTTAGDSCTGAPVSFNIAEGADTPVSVALECAAPGTPSPVASGSAVVTATFTSVVGSCEPILEKIVVTPAAITESSVSVSIEAFAFAGSSATLDVSASSGTIVENSDTQWTFTCGAPGAVTFTVTGDAGAPCVETASVPFTCPGVVVPPTCGDGAVNQASEQCEPPGTATCDANCQTLTPPTCGDGVVNQASEQCEPPGTATCDANCQTIVVVPPTCGDGVVNQASEQCEPPGTATCDANCQTIASVGPCLACAQFSCAFQYGEVFDGTPENFAGADAVLSCAFGPGWEDGGAAAADVCSRTSSLFCLCGTQSDLLCIALGGNGPCNAVMTEQGQCEGQASIPQCAGERALDHAYPVGDAMQLIECERANCATECGFN